MIINSTKHKSSGSSLFIITAVGFFCAGVYFMLISMENSNDLIHRIVKTIPCIMLALWVFLDRTPSLFSRFAVLGLLSAAVGDWLLVGTGELSFLLGVGANILAHIWYIAGFSHQYKSLKPLRAIVPLLFAAGLFLFFLRPHVEGVMMIAVIAYSAIIALMAWRAMVSIGSIGKISKFEILLSLGACLFMACDTLIALTRFVAPIPHAGYLIMICYWSGQFLIAYSVINLKQTEVLVNNLIKDKFKIALMKERA